MAEIDPGELHPLRSLVSSVLGHFDLFLKVQSDQGPNSPRTEVSLPVQHSGPIGPLQRIQRLKIEERL